MRKHHFIGLLIIVALNMLMSTISDAWNDETHIAIAKKDRYKKWFNAAGADIAKIKAGYVEKHNHFSNNPPDNIITDRTILKQTKNYNTINPTGHLYGAIIASVRDYLKQTQKGKYAKYHLAYCVHYIGDLSQPLHNTLYNAYNKKNHITTDGIINDEVLENLSKIKIYPIEINSERDLVSQIARIANLSLKLGYKIESENRLITKNEAYKQIGHSASLIKALLVYLQSVH